MKKLPRVDLSFWVMKICATTLGETAGDLLSMTLNGWNLSASRSLRPAPVSIRTTDSPAAIRPAARSFLTA